MKLTGKTAVVTGGTKGIGAELCRLFSQAGANTVCLARSCGEGAEGIDFFAMTAAELETQNIKVYIDSSDKGTKIKFEFDDTDKGENSVFGKGSAIFSFGANNLLRGYQMNYELQGLKIFVELKPFNGKVTLPNDLDTYTGLSIGA